MDKSKPMNLAYTLEATSKQNQSSKLHNSFLSWGPTQAQHLLMRSGFGASHEDLIQASSLSQEEIIDRLFYNQPLPDPPGDWITEPYILRGLSQEERREKQRQNRINFRELNAWWINQMINDPYCLREKMTLFWHGHFVVESVTVKVAQYLYIYNDMLRRNDNGNPFMISVPMSS